MDLACLHWGLPCIETDCVSQRRRKDNDDSIETDTLLASQVHQEPVSTPCMKAPTLPKNPSCVI
jgi:hypothetical protein